MPQSTSPATEELAGLDLGPAMAALNEKQRLFVLNYALTGGNTTQAAVQSGYGGNPQSSYQTGHRLLQDPKIRAAIKEDAERRLNNGAGLAAAGLIQIGLTSLDEKNRIKAYTTVLSLAGINPVARHEHVHVHQTAASIESEIRKMAGILGLDAEKLLGYEEGDVIDAEFVALPAPAEVEPEEWETIPAPAEEEW